MSERRPERAGWQLERSAPEAYERYLVPALFAPWAEQLVDAAEIAAGDRVLDAGCGTGVAARRAAERVGDAGAVVGLDVNEGMLDVAEGTATEGGASVEWRCGDVTDLPFPDGAFDAVLCQQALQFVTDPAAALREFRRVLRPGGRVAVSVWRPVEYNPAYVELAALLDRLVGDDAGAMMRSPFPDWDGDDLRSLAREADLDGTRVAVEVGSVRYPSAAEFVRREAASSPLAARLTAVDPEVRETLVREVATALGDYVDDEGVVSPMESYVLTARR